MIGIADGNNFYCSCESVFNTSLIGTPIVVLSNNDGCVISRSAKAKEIGVKMGAPAFLIKDLIKKHKVNVFSSNYTLYGEMSRRMMNIFALFFPKTEIYSIDECFLSLDGISPGSAMKLATEARATVLQWIGIPTSIGIAETKTLAKLANKLAKKAAATGVFVIDESNRIECLKNYAIGDVWGIGRQYQAFLINNGVNTAYDLTQKPDDWIKTNMSIVGLRLAKELRGEKCVEMLEQRTIKKAIATTRSFGKMLSNLEDISEAVASHAARCSEKLRAQKSCANLVTVFIHTNEFRQDLKQYSRSIIIKLPEPSNSAQEIIKHALRGLGLIYREGFKYKKAGVILEKIQPQEIVQTNLFEYSERKKQGALDKVLDKMNNLYGIGTLKVGSQGTEKRFKLKQELLSPFYTSRWSDILKVYAK